MATAVNNVYVYVNDLPIKYTPNTLSLNDGRGERVVRTQAIGGGATELIVTDNLETHKGMVKFQLRNDVELIELVLGWRDALDQNVVHLVFQQGDVSWSKTFKQATIINNVEYELQAEGNIEVEFETAVPK